MHNSTIDITVLNLIECESEQRSEMFYFNGSKGTTLYPRGKFWTELSWIALKHKTVFDVASDTHCIPFFQVLPLHTGLSHLNKCHSDVIRGYLSLG